MGRHRFEALPEKRNVLSAVHKAHMRNRMDEGLRVRDRALLHQIGPELSRQVELHIDSQRLGNVDASIAALRRVVQLAIRGMAGAGIVPGVGALQGRTAERLEHHDVERRFELLQAHRQRGAHDPGADEDDIRFLDGRIAYHGRSP
jgi:hypothetical protein